MFDQQIKNKPLFFEQRVIKNDNKEEIIAISSAYSETMSCANGEQEEILRGYILIFFRQLGGFSHNENSITFDFYALAHGQITKGYNITMWVFLIFSNGKRESKKRKATCTLQNDVKYSRDDVSPADFVCNIPNLDYRNSYSSFEISNSYYFFLPTEKTLLDPIKTKEAISKGDLIDYSIQENKEKYKTTIGGAYLQKEVKLKNGHILKLHIWDTGGQEKFRSMADLYYKDAVAAILVYDVSNPETLDSLEYWIKELNEKVGENIIISIAGNKCDLPPEQKKIHHNQGKNFCKENDVTIFNETSAKTGFGVKELFTALAHKVYDIQKNEGK